MTTDRRGALRSPAGSVDAFVALGSNLANPRRQIETAFAALARLARTRVVATSSLYRTAPQGVTSRQPPYLNAVVQLATALDPDALLNALQTIERAQKRRRRKRNAPRSIDLDLLTYGALRRSSGWLQVPHPRLHRRAFVMIPLLEIAPDLALPGLGRIRKFLPLARAQRVTRVA